MGLCLTWEDKDDGSRSEMLSASRWVAGEGVKDRFLQVSGL